MSIQLFHVELSLLHVELFRFFGTFKTGMFVGSYLKGQKKQPGSALH